MSVIEVLGKIAESPITALVVALLLGAIAMSGKLGINIAQWLLVGAILSAFLGVLRAGLKDWRLTGSAMCLSLAVYFAMAYWVSVPKASSLVSREVPALEPERSPALDKNPRKNVRVDHSSETRKGVDEYPEKRRIRYAEDHPLIYISPDAGNVNPDDGKGKIVSFAVVNPGEEEITDIRVFVGYFFARKDPTIRVSRIGPIIVVPQFDSPLVRSHSQFDFKLNFSTILEVLSKVRSEDVPGAIRGVRFSITFRRSPDGKQFSFNAIYEGVYDNEDKTVYLLTLDSSKRAGKNPFSDKLVSLSELEPFLVDREDWQPAVFDINADHLIIR